MRVPTPKLAVYALMLLALVLLGLWVARGKRASSGLSADAGSQARHPLYYYDPMAPDQHFDKPGKSPFMDMQLVPKYPDRAPTAQGHDDGTVAVDPRVAQSLGVRLVSVEAGQFARVVDTVGMVGVDEHRTAAVQVRAAGWVEELGVRAVGDAVRRGRLLARVYSPELLAAEKEFLIALGAHEAQLVTAARARLGLSGLTEGQIERISNTGKVERLINYYAPFDGYVMALGVRQGSRIETNTIMFELAEMGSVWITAEVPEAQAAWIKGGDPAQAEAQALPGQRFEGHIDYVYPELVQATRTLKLRIVVSNPGGTLRPGMFVTPHLQGAAQERVLVVLSEAVIKTGVRSIVILAQDSTHFRPVQVRVGTEYAGRSEILEGLEQGQQVVASGQFLIDSEANLRGALEKLGPAQSPSENGESGPMPLPPQGQ